MKAIVCRAFGPIADLRWEEVQAAKLEPGQVRVAIRAAGVNFADTLKAWGGRYLVIGFAAGRIPQLPVNHPLVKGYDVVGVRYDVWRDRFWTDARANLEQILGWVAEERMQAVVSRTEAMADAVAALDAIARRQVVGKVVLTNPVAD